MGADPRPLSSALQKYDYDSSTVRKKFFREALLQITIPFLLKKLAPTCKGVRGGEQRSVEGLRHPSRIPRDRDLPVPHPADRPLPPQELAKFQELIFEDFASFILVENTYEEVVLQSVMKDIMQGRETPQCARPVWCWVSHEEGVTARRVLGVL